jgi:hypothetical protein
MNASSSPAVSSSPAQATPSGPQVSVRAIGDRGNASGARPGGIVLDLVTGANSITDSLDTLVRMLAAAMSAATGAQIESGLFLQQSKRPAAMAATGQQALHLVRLEQEIGQGPLTDAMAGGHPVAMNHGHNDSRWAEYLQRLRPTGFRSVLSVRLRLDDGAQSALAFFAPETQAFPLQAIAEARSLADLGSRSLNLVLKLTAASTAASDLRSALESRTSIDIACGVIMGQNRCSYSEAFGIISRASSHRNIKLRKVAEGILDNLPGGAPRTHFDH